MSQRTESTTTPDEDVQDELQFDDGDMMLEEEVGDDVQEDQFGQKLVQISNAVCSNKPQDQQETCYSNFESIQTRLPHFAQDIGVGIEDAKTTIENCAPCMMGNEEVCSAKPLQEMFQIELTCQEFVSNLFTSKE